jgi:hypothetical protein
MINRHRGIGWEYLHVAVDDASRLALTELLPDERTASTIVFLERALAWFARHGVRVERIMTDNGNAHRSHDSATPASTRACGACAPGPTHRPLTARPNSSSRRSCANAPTAAPSGPQGSGPTPCLAGCNVYNMHRPHTAPAGQPRSAGSP